MIMNEIIIEDLIEDFNLYKNNVITALEMLPTLFRTGQIESALARVLDFSEGVGWLIKAHKYFVMHNVQSLLDEDNILEMLNEINEALENQDYFLTADIFEYEVKKFFLELNDVSKVQ